MKTASSAPPLSGIRVLDLSRVLAGPWTTQNLADLGAEVIKVERPGAGDETRSWGPPYVKSARSQESTYFLSCNRGKKSIAIDLAKPLGAELVRELAGQVDVVVENFKTGSLQRYGLEARQLSSAYPKLIVASISGFGSQGPYRNRQVYDALIQAMGGLMSITGEADSVPGGGPQKVGVAIVDVVAGLYATSAILAALFERQRSGLGQCVEISLMNAQLAALANQAGAFLNAGVVPGRMGSSHPSIVPYRPFLAKDGALMLTCANDAQFSAFCEGAGKPELARDPRFATNTARVSHRTELESAVQELVAGRNVGEWSELGEKLGFPCGPVNTIERAFADPHVKASGAVVETRHSDLGAVRSVANPMLFSRTPVVYRLPPPRIGEHTREVLRDFGVSEERLKALTESGAIT